MDSFSILLVPIATYNNTYVVPNQFFWYVIDYAGIPIFKPFFEYRWLEAKINNFRKIIYKKSCLWTIIVEANNAAPR